MGHEVIEKDGVRFAEIIWAGTYVQTSTFFSPEISSLQFGLLAHKAGFIEPPHYHPSAQREITDVQQMFFVQRGRIAVEFYSDSKTPFREVQLGPGDAILLVHGVHAIRVLEDMHCISIKQGPFFGPDQDKVEVGA